MALPKVLRFEGIARPGKPEPTGAMCFYTLSGKRAPRKGEWYVSGAIPMAYKAPADLSSEYQIAEPTHFAKVAEGFVPGDAVSLKVAP